MVVSIMLLGSLLFWGLFMVLTSSSFFMMWLGVEVILFTTVGLVEMGPCNSYFISSKGNSLSSFVYYMFQMVGTLLLVSGVVFSFKLYLMFFGLVFKLSLFPGLWWVPYLVSWLDWLSFFVISVLKKFFVFYLISLLLLQSLFWLISLVVVLGVVGSLMGMYMKKMSLKVLLGWGGVLDASLMLWVSFYSFIFFCYYYVSYFVMVGLVCFLGNLLESEGDGSLFLLDKVWLVLGFMGVPPLFGFIYKCIVLHVLFSSGKGYWMWLILGFVLYFQGFCYYLWLRRGLYMFGWGVFSFLDWGWIGFSLSVYMLLLLTFFF